MSVERIIQLRELGELGVVVVRDVLGQFNKFVLSQFAFGSVAFGTTRNAIFGFVSLVRIYTIHTRYLIGMSASSECPRWLSTIKAGLRYDVLKFISCQIKADFSLACRASAHRKMVIDPRGPFFEFSIDATRYAFQFLAPTTCCIATSYSQSEGLYNSPTGALKAKHTVLARFCNFIDDCQKIDLKSRNQISQFPFGLRSSPFTLF